MGKSKALLSGVSDQELRLLRIFVVIARSGGLAAAELALNISRSTISRHLKDLEGRLGVTLCRRGRGGFQLTADGEQVLAAALRLFGAVEDFRGSVEELNERLRGRIVVALFDKTITNPEAQLADAFRRFDARAPEARLEIHVAPTDRIVAGVLDGGFHVGVIPTRPSAVGLEYSRLYGERMRLYCGRRHGLFTADDAALDLERLRASNYAGIGFHSPNMDASVAFGFTRSAEVFDQEALATLILSGRYIGFLPTHYAEDFVRRKVMRPLMGRALSYRCDFGAIARAGAERTRLVDAFLDCLRAAHAGVDAEVSPI